MFVDLFLFLVITLRFFCRLLNYLSQSTEFQHSIRSFISHLAAFVMFNIEFFHLVFADIGFVSFYNFVIRANLPIYMCCAVMFVLKYFYLNRWISVINKFSYISKLVSVRIQALKKGGVLGLGSIRLRSVLIIVNILLNWLS